MSKRKDVVLATMKIPAGTLGPNDPLPPFKLRKQKAPYITPSAKSSIVMTRINQAKRIKALEAGLRDLLNAVQLDDQAWLLMQEYPAVEAAFILLAHKSASAERESSK